MPVITLLTPLDYGQWHCLANGHSSNTLLSLPTYRVLIGAFHGVVHPALYFMFQNWFPKKEQSTALSMLLLGTSLGLILNVPIAGAIGDLDILNGWPLLFYGGSALHIVWLLVWAVFVTDKPELHKSIKDKEIGYIRQNSQNILETVS